MGRFKLVRTISLKDISDGWTDKTFIKFNVLSPEDSSSILPKIKAAADDEEKLMQIFREVLKTAFIEGKVQLPGEADVSDALADDIDDLPKGVIVEAYTRVNGNIYTNPNV